MVERVPIVRQSIKIRKPIQKDFCRCHKVGVVVVNGIPQLVTADEMSPTDMSKYLDSVSLTTPVYFHEYTYINRESMIECLDRNIPVTIRTEDVLDEEILRRLSSVPHSGIHVSIDFLEGSYTNFVEDLAPRLDSLRKMMFLAKSWKIFIGLVVSFLPHITNKLDLYEVCEALKNCSSHVMISFPEIPDIVYNDRKHEWPNFKTYYQPYIPDRSWIVKESCRKSTLEDLNTFLSSRKMSIENISIEPMERIRHIPTGLSDLALGIRPFYYVKDENGNFSEGMGEEQPCSTCGRTLLM
jgi:DNA repair photolyase